uniref:Uncharacterized protein n=1 Tax=Fagus sylvatica TaxID=28930 RepID=A0A2N9G5H2_FAGSY
MGRITLAVHTRTNQFGRPEFLVVIDVPSPLHSNYGTKMAAQRSSLQTSATEGKDDRLRYMRKQYKRKVEKVIAGRDNTGSSKYPTWLSNTVVVKKKERESGELSQNHLKDLTETFRDIKTAQATIERFQMRIWGRLWKIPRGRMLADFVAEFALEPRDRGSNLGTIRFPTRLALKAYSSPGWIEIRQKYWELRTSDRLLRFVVSSEVKSMGSTWLEMSVWSAYLLKVQTDHDRFRNNPHNALASTNLHATFINTITVGPCWMDPYVTYLKEGVLPEQKKEAGSYQKESLRGFWLSKDLKLYKTVLLGTLSFMRSTLTSSRIYYTRYMKASVEVILGADLWHTELLPRDIGGPTCRKNAVDYVKKCDKCQRFSHSVHQPAGELQPLVSPWPFAQWGMDLVGPLPKATVHRHILRVMDKPKPSNKTVLDGIKKRLEDAKGRWVEELPNVLMDFQNHSTNVGMGTNEEMTWLNPRL